MFSPVAGLSKKEIQEKSMLFGKNVLPEEKTIPAFRIFLLQFANPLVYVLGFAGLISFFLEKYLDIGLIFLVVLINALMGFFQENKTQKTLLALKKLVKPLAKVFRNGQKEEIDAADLVPGDVVFLGAGDRVPADGKILEAVSFFINEAVLTGESEAVEKKTKDLVYMGTIISSGRAVVQIEKIGLKTKIGEIAETLKETEQPPTTLQIRLKKLSQTLIWITVLLSVAVFVFGFLIGTPFWEMAEISAVLLVAIMPEALLIVITFVLVLAMRESLKRKALIRKILAVETLGSVTTICTDKTGTLTEGKMRVAEESFIDSEKSLLAMCLCNDLNDNVETALWNFLKKKPNFNPKEVFDRFERLFEIPFSSEHKFMATVNALSFGRKKIDLWVKGAPEEVLVMTKLSAEERKKMMKEIDRWAQKGLKVLALAGKEISQEQAAELKVEKISGLQWLGMVGLWDPPRQEVKEALVGAAQAGLKVKVVTGDYYRTAEKVMDFLGIKIRPEEKLEGGEMEKMKKSELMKKISQTLLFSRVTPKQKLLIVSILQELGEVVAMTGDGVNDAPALKKSNIGIVVGDASEVAKETADLILLDNNFKRIISAIEAGRLVFENIKKIILFILSNSFAELVVILGALVLGWPFPLSVIQILWLNLLCDGPEDLVLGFEPKEKETMLDGPKRIDEPLLGRVGIFLVTAVSFFSGIFSLIFFWYFGLFLGDLVLGSTMAFMSLATSSIVYIFSFRTLRKPFWRYENFWQNPWLFAVVIFSLALLVALPYWPLTGRLLNLAPLEFFHWELLAIKTVVLVLIIELLKLKMMKGTDISKSSFI